MRVVFLVPRRKDNGPRDALWAYARRRWETLFPDWPVIEGHHDDGPFNRSKAINRAAEEAGEWDVAIVIDSDVMVSRAQVVAAVERASEPGGPVTWAHRRWRGIRRDATERLVADRYVWGDELDRDELDLIVERTNPLSWSCCIAIPRWVFDDLGGFDERFEGWGFEDMAFQSVICGLYPWDRIEGDVVHLWHPRSEERIVPGQPRLTATREYVVNARLGRRYMVALRRDHGGHDRMGGPASEEERKRDINNLRADDAKYGEVVRQLGLPDWSEWWPTLPELRAGARTARLGTDDVTVSIVVRTGGSEGTWPERSAYLARSLASLSERVSGDIVQRVIYSDWDDEFAGALAEIARPFGFYVVGGGHHGYTPAVRRLWGYLDRRATGRFVFLAEDDFIYDRDVDLSEMAATLNREPRLAQLALLRGPAYPREMTGDGILGWPRDSFTSLGDRIEHRLFWTMNPSLFRRDRIVKHDWPGVASSERVFGDNLLRDPSTRFAFVGDGEPWITHIGETRAVAGGAGY